MSELLLRHPPVSHRPVVERLELSVDLTRGTEGSGTKGRQGVSGGTTEVGATWQHGR